jgi:hypothetical protein
MSTATPTSHHGSPKADAGASPSAGARSSAMAASVKRDDGPAGRRVWTLADFGDLEHIMRKWVVDSDRWTLVVIPAMTSQSPLPDSSKSTPARRGRAMHPTST